MSNLAWMIFIVFVLTLLGAGTLAFITIKFYWGDRGKPPLTGEERHLQKEREMRLRARQIERSRKNPIKTRKESFWDNSKVD